VIYGGMALLITYHYCLGFFNCLLLCLIIMHAQQRLYSLYNPCYNPSTGLRTPWPPLFKTWV